MNFHNMTDVSVLRELLSLLQYLIDDGWEYNVSSEGNLTSIYRKIDDTLSTHITIEHIIEKEYRIHVRQTANNIDHYVMGVDVAGNYAKYSIHYSLYTEIKMIWDKTVDKIMNNIKNNFSATINHIVNKNRQNLHKKSDI